MQGISPLTSLSGLPVGRLGGARLFPGFLDRAAQTELFDAARDVLAVAPAFRPTMPRSGQPFSVLMTNCGPLGWMSDRRGYRYEPCHPDTGEAWPPIPAPLLAIWEAVSGCPTPPEACLFNLYTGEARMGPHRDSDEQELRAPVVSISLGAPCLFRIGGLSRKGPTVSFRIQSGDVLVLGGESRLVYHGVDRILPGALAVSERGDLGAGLEAIARINFTLRRVTPF